MGELPCLHVCGRALGARCLRKILGEMVMPSVADGTYAIDLVEAIHIQLPDKTREL